MEGGETVKELGEGVQQLAVTSVRFARDVGAQLASALAVLAERERELLELKGPCSTAACRLHYAHAGPCDIR